MKRVLSMLSILLVAGCVSYVPADVSELKPQDKVRMRLEQQELARLVAFADPGRGTVTGRVLHATPDSIEVVVSTGGSYTQVAVPRSSILGLERGYVDRTKNVLVSAAFVGGVAALAVIGFEGRNENSVGDDTGTDEVRIPLFNIRIPFGLGFGR